MANNKTTYDNKQIETTTTDNNSFKNNISATDVSISSNDIESELIKPKQSVSLITISFIFLI